MRLRRIILVLALVLLAAWLVVFWSLVPAEPVYQGKELRLWLADLDYSGRPYDLAARNAVQQMSTAVLPHLRPMFHARDSQIKKKMMQFLARQPLIRVDYIPAAKLQQRAANACRALGPAAIEYLPELRAMLDSTNNHVAWCGLAILDVKGRSNCVPELRKGLTNSFAQLRWFSADVLGEVWGYARSAVPDLILCLRDPDSEVREHARSTLVKFRSDPDTIVPALVECLSAFDAPTRRWAATCLPQFLQQFKSAAMLARLKLIELQNDPDPEVRRAAEIALRGLPLSGK